MTARLKNLYFVLALGLSLSFIGQNTYSFQKSTATFTPLTGNTVVSGSSPWSPFTAHPVPIGFTFNYFGNNYTTINCEGSGFCVFDPSFYYFTLHPYTVEMRDAGTGSSTSQSPISYRLDGITPNRICKIEWKNCELKNDLGSYVNFQLWLYETSNIIEMRIGNCTINNPAAGFMNNGFDGPVIGLYKTQGSVTHYGYCVQGASPTETLLTLNTGTISNIFQNSMSAPPPSGKVYQFSPVSGTSIKETSILNGREIYPNPVSRFLIVSMDHEESWEMANAQGAVIKSGYFGAGNNSIDVSDLSAGIYFLNTKNGSTKLIKE